MPIMQRAFQLIPALTLHYFYIGVAYFSPHFLFSWEMSFAEIYVIAFMVTLAVEKVREVLVSDPPTLPLKFSLWVCFARLKRRF